MHCVPRKETIMFAKIDLSDGFWRMLVRKLDKWNFAYVLPGAAGDPLQRSIPHTLKMGWTESPGYFCAATETGRDIMQALIEEDTWLRTPTCIQLVHVPRRSCPPPEFSRSRQTMADVGRLCR